jgi:myo-inositol-1(or 4)-monophosphatase
LCGTLNFAAQTPLMSVNIALREAGRIQAAACADPVTGEMFWTDGQHACRRLGGSDVVLRPSAGTRLVDLNLDPPYPNRDRFQAVRVLADPAFAAAFRPRVVSTTLALAWVAAGRRAGYVTDGHLRDSVHFSSGIALCQSAGCVITGLRGQPLHTGAGGLVAAADSETHAALIEIIGHQLAEPGLRTGPGMKPPRPHVDRRRPTLRPPGRRQAHDVPAGHHARRPALRPRPRG